MVSFLTTESYIRQLTNMELIIKLGNNTYYSLKGSGEMSQLIRSYNWAATPFWVPVQWLQSLKITLGIMLRSASLCVYSNGSVITKQRY